MTIFEMLGQSTILTVLGMAVVFGFLWIMIICVNLTSKLIAKKGGEEEEAQFKDETPSITGAAPGHIAAITAAVTEHQKGE